MLINCICFGSNLLSQLFSVQRVFFFFCLFTLLFLLRSDTLIIKAMFSLLYRPLLSLKVVSIHLVCWNKLQIFVCLVSFGREKGEGHCLKHFGFFEASSHSAMKRLVFKVKVFEVKFLCMFFPLMKTFWT